MFLINRIICPITISTTDLVLLYGALKTIIPFLVMGLLLIIALGILYSVCEDAF